MRDIAPRLADKGVSRKEGSGEFGYTLEKNVRMRGLGKNVEMRCRPALFKKVECGSLP